MALYFYKTLHIAMQFGLYHIPTCGTWRTVSTGSFKTSLGIVLRKEFHRYSQFYLQHYCRRGLIKIPFAPLAVVPQRQRTPSYLPSPLVFLSISTDFTPTPTVPVAPKSFNSGSIVPLSWVEPRALKNNFPNRLRNALRPINPDNACILCITAAAGLT